MTITTDDARLSSRSLMVVAVALFLVGALTGCAGGVASMGGPKTIECPDGEKRIVAPCDQYTRTRSYGGGAQISASGVGASGHYEERATDEQNAEVRQLSIYMQSICAEYNQCLRTRGEYIEAKKRWEDVVLKKVAEAPPVAARTPPTPPEPAAPARAPAAQSPQEDRPPPSGTPTVAILYFDYQGKDEGLRNLRKSIASMITYTVGGVDLSCCEIIEREELERALQEIELNQTAAFDKVMANRVGKLLGAHYMVMGNYFDFMGQIRVDARVVHVETGRIVGTAGANGAPTAMLDLPRDIARQIIRVLRVKVGGEDVPRPPAPKTETASAGPQVNVEVLQRYTQALEKLDQGNLAGALEALAELVGQHPEFEQASATLERVRRRKRDEAVTRSLASAPDEGSNAASAGANFKPYAASHAVVIGIDAYKTLKPLGGAVRDATSVAKLLRQRGFKVHTLMNEKATRAEIAGLLGDDLPNQVGPDDRVLVYFAGHGMTTGTKGHEMGYLMPVDADKGRVRSTGLNMREVQNWFAGYPAKHVMFVADACYSGLAVVTRSVGLSPRLRDYIKQITDKRSRATIVAGGMNEQVLEHNGQGLFTHFFLKAISGSADRNGDRIITLDEVGAYLKPKVSQTALDQYRRSQTPQIAADGEGEFVFLLP
jgi:TolB-like protein